MRRGSTYSEGYSYRYPFFLFASFFEQNSSSSHHGQASFVLYSPTFASNHLSYSSSLLLYCIYSGLYYSSSRSQELVGLASRCLRVSHYFILSFDCQVIHVCLASRWHGRICRCPFPAPYQLVVLRQARPLLYLLKTGLCFHVGT